MLTSHHSINDMLQSPSLLKTLWFRSANVTNETLASDARVRQVGLIYSVYRFVISGFLMLSSYSVIKGSMLAGGLPTLVESIIISIYLILSLFLLTLFYFIPTGMRWQLFLGFFVDIIFLTAYAIHGSISNLQIVLLYMIVVASSFILLSLSQAASVVIASVVAVIYQQVFFAIAEKNIHLTFGDTLLLSICLVAVAFLSWSASQRLMMAEESAIRHAQELEKLNIINDIVVKNMVNGVLVIDEHRDIVMINEAAQRLLRLPTNVELCNTPAKMVDLARLIVKEHPTLIHWYRTISPDLSVSWIYELKPDNNNPSDKLRLNNRPLASYGQLIIIEDISREQTHAQRLKLASLGQLSASIAHEIRNPLAAISQASQLLIEDVNTQDPNSELYRMIFQQTRRVNNIIEDVLSLSRQEIPDQEVVNVYRWLTEFLAHHFYDKNILINIAGNERTTVIYFDPNHLEQVMINLVNNALRHTVPLTGQADVEIKVTRHGERAFIDVIDNGMGVPDQDIPQLFHPFFTTSKKGTGLGLYLSQSFSEANNAKIRYLKDDKSCFRLIASTQRRLTH